MLAIVAQATALGTLITALADDAGRPTNAVLASTVGIAALIRIAVGIATGLIALGVYRSPASRARWTVLLVAATLLCFTGAFSSHAAGRVEGRVLLLALSAVHQAAASAWIGGLVCAALLSARTGRLRRLARPFPAPPPPPSPCSP